MLQWLAVCSNSFNLVYTSYQRPSSVNEGARASDAAALDDSVAGVVDAVDVDVVCSVVLIVTVVVTVDATVQSPICVVLACCCCFSSRSSGCCSDSAAESTSSGSSTTVPTAPIVSSSALIIGASVASAVGETIGGDGEPSLVTAVACPSAADAALTVAERDDIHVELPLLLTLRRPILLAPSD